MTRVDESIEEAVEAEEGALDATTLDAVVEAILFVATEPLTAARLANAIDGAEKTRVQASLLRLDARLAAAESGISLQEVAGGFRLTTKPAIHEYVAAFSDKRRKKRLSQAARETLAIIAYKQPMTAPEIAEIRGVESSSTIKSLLERKLVRILGRKDVVGRPILYGTSKEFLRRFGLRSLKDLPTLDEIDELTAGLEDLSEVAEEE